MTPLIRRMLGEHELKGGKLRPETVVYLNPDQIGDEGGPGCRCGKCLFFRAGSSECLLTSPAKCNAEHGVCGLFLGGVGGAEGEPMQIVTKKQAGYVEDGPTRCAGCEYYSGDETAGECEKIGGEIHPNGCCSYWEAR